MEKTILTEKELSDIQAMNAEFTKLKMAIGDLEMQKHNLLKAIEILRTDFSKHELELI